MLWYSYYLNNSVEKNLWILFNDLTERSIVVFSPESKIKEISNYSFSLISSIPNSVKRIGEGSFCNCKFLLQAIFPTNSRLISIGEFSWRWTKKSEINDHSQIHKGRLNQHMEAPRQWECLRLGDESVHKEGQLGSLRDELPSKESWCTQDSSSLAAQDE